MTTPIRPTSPAIPEPESWDRLRMLQVIEDAERQNRMCACGGLMTVSASDDALWLECPTFRDAHAGRLGWLRSGVREMLHERRAIVTGLGRVA